MNPVNSVKEFAGFLFFGEENVITNTTQYGYVSFFATSR